MYHFFTRVLFLIGFLIGVLLAILFVQITNNNINPVLPENKIFSTKNYNRWFTSVSLKRTAIPLDLIRYSKNNYKLESEVLYDSVKIFCLILVRNVKNAEAANATWSKNCNEISFVNLTTDSKKKIPVKKTKENSSWVVLCKALKSVPDDYNWIFISNDHTFVILENFRMLVAALDDNKQYYLGHAVTFWNVRYNMAQAGCALSKGSLLAIKQKLKFTNSCTSELSYWNQEDFYLGKHLNSLNITPTDTRDELGYSTFHPYNWQHVFSRGANYYKFSLYPVKCCSTKSVTFQAIEAHKIYMYYYLLYQLQVFSGGSLGNSPAPTPIPEKEVWQSFLRERGIDKEDVSPQEYYKIWEDLVHDPTEFAQELRKKAKYDYYD